MGSGVSKPNRKLTNIITKASNVNSTQAKVQLPSQKLKDQFESGEQPRPEPQLHETKSADPTEVKAPHKTPHGKDGMDPQADQGFIRMMNDLGKQIQSHSANHKEQIDVRALKQLLKRKELHARGQNEIKAQVEGSATRSARTMVNPSTLTAIVNALRDENYPREEIAKDYEVNRDFLQNMSRLKVADRLVIIEEQRRDDEVGPKIGQPVARAATEPSMMDYDGDMAESVNEERIKNLKKRLE